ncbi:hypothetical protein AVEN_187592-1 [Araneus ventricosus]|uniref:Gustatory receptor n=1 Tax=Araneus ventricosus TaxID=182803 RepID=A0A4Y2FRY9_ARAVE|nr:hypothetical protein AVEN_187592-1 [Araneus ventricosus]
MALHYGIASKKYSLQKVIVKYDKISAAIGMIPISRRKVTNVIVMSFVLIWILSATSYIIVMESYPEMKRIFSFYLVCDNYIISIFISFLGALLIIAYAYGFPSMVAMMCGIFYYEFGEILSRFRVRLGNQNRIYSANKMLCELKIHRELYKLSYDLQEAMSLICFFLLCSQMANMYCLLSEFVLTKTEDLTTSQIIEFILLIVVIPPTLIGIIWCASRINAQHQKIHTAIHLLLDSYTNLCNHDANITTYLNRMKEKQFPVMSACGVLELTPKLLLGFFGSLFTYGLLFINLKR